MKKLLLVVMLALVGNCFGNIITVDPREEGMEEFMGHTVYKIVVCDTKEEVLTLPLIKDRLHGLDSYQTDRIKGEPAKMELWTVYYLLADGMTAVIIHKEIDGTTTIYVISAYDTYDGYYGN